MFLRALCKDQFEPLESCDCKFLTWKTCFLVALSTGRRRSEIPALSGDEQLINVGRNWSNITFYPDKLFLAKNQNADMSSPPILIPALNGSPRRGREALARIYLKRTAGHRGKDKCSFFLYNPARRWR